MVSASRSCASPPSGVVTDSISKPPNSIAITILISASAR